MNTFTVPARLVDFDMTSTPGESLRRQFGTIAVRTRFKGLRAYTKTHCVIMGNTNNTVNYLH
jgi:hypothetical protein